MIARDRARFGSFGATPTVEDTIRAKITAMQGIQALLYKARTSWIAGKLLSGLPIPGALLLGGSPFDWSKVIATWQGGVDTWWNSSTTAMVRSNPTSNLQQWVDTGNMLAKYAQQISADMGDDTLGNAVKEYASKLVADLPNPLDLLGPLKPWLIGGAVLWALSIVAPLLPR